QTPIAHVKRCRLSIPSCQKLSLRCRMRECYPLLMPRSTKAYPHNTGTLCLSRSSH
ncbi:hypothetical protein GGI09_008172, partial [Coemansia sp. S100]